MGQLEVIHTTVSALKETPRKVRGRQVQRRMEWMKPYFCSRALIASEPRGDKEDGRQSGTSWSRESVCPEKASPGKKSHRNLGLRVRVKLSRWVQGSEYS